MFYVTLKREEIALVKLDAEERLLVDELIDRQLRDSNWQAFRNEWISRVDGFYVKRGMSKREIVLQPAWRIGRDLSSRLMVRMGLVLCHG